MGQQVKPQHNTPHPDHSLYIFCCTQGLTWTSPPPSCCPPPLAPGQGASTDPSLPCTPSHPAWGRGEPAPQLKGINLEVGDLPFLPCPRAQQERKIVFPKLSYSFLLGLMHTHTHTEQPQLEGLLSLFACPHSSCGPQQPWSVPSCVSRTRNQAAPLWLLHSTSSSAHKAVLRRHHQGTARGQALGFCSKASCRHCS